MCFISGENDPYVHTVRKRVCCRTSLPSGFMLNSSCHCFDQSADESGVVREELNMMREPSADQCGCESSPLVCVSCTMPLPSAFITKISECPPGSPAKTICRMSGD